MSKTLTIQEKQALKTLNQTLREHFGEIIQKVVLFGSKARNEDHPESDLDVLIVVDSDDWRIHKEICYLALDVGLAHEVYHLSPRIWSTSHLRQMASIDAALYRHIQQDGIAVAV